MDRKGRNRLIDAERVLMVAGWGGRGWRVAERREGIKKYKLVMEIESIA